MLCLRRNSCLAPGNLLEPLYLVAEHLNCRGLAIGISVHRGGKRFAEFEGWPGSMTELILGRAHILEHGFPEPPWPLDTASQLALEAGALSAKLISDLRSGAVL